MKTIEEIYTIYKKYPLVCTDTRKIQPDSIFCALKGSNFNGNEFAEDALKKGSKYAIIDEKKFYKDERFILVEDVLTFLQTLSQHHRKQLNIPVIAITGSNGKTTTKELIRMVLAKKFKTFATQGNLNNHIGVPLTLLSINDSCEIAVIEMGANHIGEIAFLSDIAQPNFGIITNIGKAHLEGFGSLEGVKKAKSELYDYIKKYKGNIFVNYDNKLLRDLSSKISRITYGTDETCDCSGKLISVNPFVTLKYKWKTEEKKTNESNEIKSYLLGMHNFENILAAICIGSYFGVEHENIKEAIENYLPSNSRSQLIEKGTNKIILDAYNANPSSMKLAIENFSKLKVENKVLILGGMAELGTESIEEHITLINLIQKYNWKFVTLVGGDFLKINHPFLSFENNIEAKNWLQKQKFENSYLLVKGSRSIKLEIILDA